MSWKSYWQMRGLVAASILSAAAVGLLASPSASLAQDATSVTVVPSAPTSLTISIAHKTPHQVFLEVRAASHVVCRNAYRNGDLGPYGEAYSWCPERATDVAYTRYQAILKSNPTIAVAALTIASPAARD